MTARSVSPWPMCTQVFPDGVPVMSIEAAGVHGWTKYAHASYGMNGYGLSAPGAKVLSVCSDI